jgi:ankyrin repeat protein
MKKTILLLLGLTTLFVSCDDELRIEKFNESYTKLCEESATVPLAKLNNSSTCNGLPLLEALLYADDYIIKNNLADIIFYLVDRKKFKLDFLVQDNFSYLQAVVQRRQIRIGSRMLRRKTPLLSESFETTALHTAIEYAKLEDDKNLAWFIKNYKGDISKENTFGQTPIQDVYEKKLHLSTWQLVEMGADYSFLLEKLVDREIDLDLLFSENISVAKDMLLESGLAINEQYTYRKVQDFALVHYAAANNNMELISILMEAGADFTLESSLGTPLEIAAFKGHKDLVTLILENRLYDESDRAVTWALRGANLALATTLLEHGLQINSYRGIVSQNREYTTQSWLEEFIYHGSILNRMTLNSYRDTVVERQELPIREEKTGNNILHSILALRNNSTESYNKSNYKFFKAKAKEIFTSWKYIDIEKQYNKLGQSPLVYSLYYYGTLTVDPLNKLSVSTSSTMNLFWGKLDNLGFYPIHYAFMNKRSLPSKKILKNYIGRGAMINAITPLNETILTMACRFGNYEIAKYLLEGGLFRSRPSFDVKTAINLKNNKNEAPLDLAYKAKNKKLIKLLKKHGAK